MNKRFFMLVIAATAFLISCNKKKSVKVELNVFTADSITGTDSSKLSDGIAALCLPYYESEGTCNDVALIPAVRFQRVDFTDGHVFEYLPCENTLEHYKEQLHWVSGYNKLEEIARENLNQPVVMPNEFKVPCNAQPAAIDAAVKELMDGKQGTKFYCYSDNESVSQYFNLPVYHQLDSMRAAILSENCAEQNTSLFILYNVAHQEEIKMDSIPPDTLNTANAIPEVKTEEVVHTVKRDTVVHKKKVKANVVKSSDAAQTQADTIVKKKAEPAVKKADVVVKKEAAPKKIDTASKVSAPAKSNSSNTPASTTLNITHTEDDLSIQWNDLGKNYTYEITVFYPEDNTSFHAKPKGLTYQLSNLEHKNHNYSVLLLAKDNKGHKVRACFNNFHITEDGKIVSGFCDQLRDRLQNKCD